MARSANQEVIYSKGLNELRANNTSIIELPGCQLTLSDVRDIADALSENTHVETLNLSHNPGLLEFDNVRLTEVLKDNKTIKRLNLQDCELKAKGTEFVLNVIQKNKSINQLDCDLDAFKPEEREIIDRELLINQTLKRMQTQNDAFLNLPSHLKNDLKFVLKLIEKANRLDNYSIIQYLHPDLQNNKTVIKAAGIVDQGAYQFASPQLKSSKDFVLDLTWRVRDLKHVLIHLPDSLKNDNEVLLSIAEREPDLLLYVSDTLKNDRKFIDRVMAASNTCKNIAKYLSEAQRDDRELMLAIAHKDLNAFEYASPRLKNEKAFILEYSAQCVIFNNNSIAKHINETHRDDVEIMNALSKVDRNIWQYSSSRLRNNKKIILDQIEGLFSYDNNVTEYLADNLKDDPELILAVARRDKNAFKFASDRLKNDRDFVLRFLKMHGESRYQVSSHLPDTLKNDKELFLVIAKDKDSDLQHASPQLKNDKDFILQYIHEKMISKFSKTSIIDLIADSLKDDSDVILAAAKIDTNALKCASTRLKNNKAFWLKVIEQSPDVVDGLTEHLPLSLRDEPDIFLAAAKKENYALKSTSTNLKNNKSFILQMIQETPKAKISYLMYVLPKILEKDKDIIFAAALKDKFVLNYSELRADKEFMTRIIKQDGSLWEFASDELKTDVSLKKLAEKGYLKKAVRDFDHRISLTRLKNEQIQLSQLPYCVPNSIERELYAQVSKTENRAGRINLPKVPVETKKDIESQLTYLSVSGKEDPIMPILQTHFGNDLALYQYSIFYPETEQVKGVIFSHYGGYGQHDFNATSESLTPQDTRLVREGYILVNYISHDNWQTCHQSDQVSSYNKEGIHLLNKTLAQALLAADAVKKHFQLPLIFYGGSFGGFKGILLNELLSNKEQMNTCDIFTPLMPVLTATDSKVFDAYVVHDPALASLQRLSMNLPNTLLNPTLILHNFDDERVKVDVSIDFIKTQLPRKKEPGKITLHVTAQGAAGPLQMNSSTDGHFTPRVNSYNQDYYKLLNGFLDNLDSESNQKRKTSLLEIRHKHAQRLNKNDDVIKTKLYRLYFALLHSDEPAKTADSANTNPMMRRMQRCFSLLASEDTRDNKQEVYNELQTQYGPWLIAAILDKRKSTGQFLSQSIKKAKDVHNAETTKSQRFFSLKADKKMESTKEEPFKAFTLTTDASLYLKTCANPLELIRRCVVSAKQIDKKTLMYFEKNPNLVTLDDFARLWDLGELRPQLKIDINLASRLMSIVRIYYNGVELQCKILESIQDYSIPMFVIAAFGRHSFKPDECYHFMQKYLSQSPKDRENFLELVTTLCRPFGTNKIELIDWICTLEPGLRATIVPRYELAVQELNLDKAGELKLRENPELLLGDFGETVASVQDLRKKLKEVVPTSMKGPV